MIDFDLTSASLGRSDCFLPERKFLLAALNATRGALLADQLDSTTAAVAVRQAMEQVDCDEDICAATDIGMRADLSGTESEDLARCLRLLGARSSARSMDELRVAYASCVRELHVSGRVVASKGLMADLAIQLIDPIRALPAACAGLATIKVIVELLSLVDLEVDAFQGAMWLRIFHPQSQIGGATALMSLIADYQASSDSTGSGLMSFERPPSPNDAWASAKRVSPEKQGSAQGESGG